MTGRATGTRLAILTSCIAAVAGAGDAASRPALVDLPGFGVAVPAAQPGGFEPSDSLEPLLGAGTIARWRRATGGPFDAARDEQVVLLWRIAGFTMDVPSVGGDDEFENVARNPYGATVARPGDFVRAARRVDVPHPRKWPTLRFEMPGGVPDAEGFVRVEAVAANNLCYVLIHRGGAGGASDAGRDAFDAIAAALTFAPPAPLGRAIKLDGEKRRIVVARHNGASGVDVALPEPFRRGGNWPGASASDLTFFLRRAEETDRRTFGATMRFERAGATCPEWVRWHTDAGYRVPTTWPAPVDGVQLFGPLESPLRSEAGERMIVAGAPLDGAAAAGDWFWIGLRLPAEAIADAGGDQAIAGLLRSMLRGARPATREQAAAATRRGR